MKTKQKKVKIEIQYTREYTICKTVEVSQETADRLLALDGEGSLLEGRAVWSSDNPDDVSTDDFTMIAEDLTSAHDIMDALNEIEDIRIEKVS